MSREVDLRTEDRGDVRVLVIDRAESKNALNANLRLALLEAFRQADADEGVRSVVLTAVDPVFSAGVDFKERPSGPNGAAGPSDNPAHALRAMKKPVVCAVNGACVSGALELALSATFIVASERARFADTHATIGVVPTWGLSALLPRAIGIRKARELSITGTYMGAEEALRVGLVNHVVPHDKLLPFALERAAAISGTPAVNEMLDLYNRGEDLDLSDALATEAAHSAGRRYDFDAFTAAGRAASARLRGNDPPPL
jgi:enoyl-CoA hydratase